MARWWNRVREFFTAEPVPAQRDYFADIGSRETSGGYWDNARLDDVFAQVNPAEQYGYSAEFTRNDEREGMRLFQQGWVSRDVSKSDREEFRERFFDWMSEYDIYSDDFPWDDWRDWYESQ